MACQRCIEAGRQKTVHYARCGRWETRVFCEHTYKREKLNSRETGHGQGRYGDKIRRRPTKNCDRVKYTHEMDDFILARYSSKGRWVRTEFYGTGQMKKLAAEFGERFGIPTARPNQLIGRWNRLVKRLRAAAEEARPVPSLPVLKFMQDECGGRHA
jgi:hypothetical protein